MTDNNGRRLHCSPCLINTWSLENVQTVAKHNPVGSKRKKNKNMAGHIKNLIVSILLVKQNRQIKKPGGMELK